MVRQGWCIKDGTSTARRVVETPKALGSDAETVGFVLD
jgi:hypothetical protein